MKTKEELQKIHSNLLADYIELIHYINSSEFICIDEKMKIIILNQKFAIQQYLDALNLQINFDKLPKDYNITSIEILTGMTSLLDMGKTTSIQHSDNNQN